MRVNVNVYNSHYPPSNPLERLLMMNQPSEHLLVRIYILSCWYMILLNDVIYITKQGQQRVEYIDADKPLDLSEIHEKLDVTLSNLAHVVPEHSADFRNLIVLISKLDRMVDQLNKGEESAENVQKVCVANYTSNNSD